MHVLYPQLYRIKRYSCSAEPLDAVQFGIKSIKTHHIAKHTLTCSLAHTLTQSLTAHTTKPKHSRLFHRQTGISEPKRAKQNKNDGQAGECVCVYVRASPIVSEGPLRHGPRESPPQHQPTVYPPSLASSPSLSREDLSLRIRSLPPLDRPDRLISLRVVQAQRTAMSGTRPIPISNRGRASPPNSSSSRGGSPSLSDLHGISQSCPVVHNGNGNGANPAGSYARFQPPRAPRFGSLPEPSFLQIDENPMPELLLPPPVHPSRNNSPAAPSVVQFASSCPVDISFMRQGNPVQHSWTPSPRALDEFDLSKSPALAVMSAAREGRAPMHNFRRVGQPQTNPHNQLNRNRSSAPSSSSTRQSYAENGLYTELMENLTITEEEQSFSDDSADFNHHSHTQSQSQSYSSRRHDQLQQQQQSSQYDRRERRGSYGSLSDNGDGGVFYFEES